MPDFANAPPVNPDPPPGVEANLDGARLDLTGKPAAPPPVIGVSVSLMPAVAAAGVLLSKLVLAIVSGSLVILVLYLTFVDGSNSHHLRLLYHSIVDQLDSDPGGDNQGRPEVDRVIQAFRDAAANAQATLPDTLQQQARDLIASASNGATVSVEQKTALGRCIPLPAADDANRAAILAACIDALQAARRALGASSVALDRARLLSDIAKQVNEQQQTFHQFWIQVAQLVLLNLLLPLLTALFGYIFGTQQAQNTRPNNS